MKTIKFNIEKEFIIKKSKFITKLYTVNNELEIKNILDYIKNEYKDSTHICYAYIVGNIKRFNDDNEPSGTAGIPILNVLENNDLNNILCVVIRYFGGIKLGAGGLIRAYSSATSKTLNETEIINLIEAKKIEIYFSYETSKKINNILKNVIILDKEFNEFIKYTIIIKNKEFESIENILKELCNKINIKEDTYIS